MAAAEGAGSVFDRIAADARYIGANVPAAGSRAWPSRGR